jgi:glycosyltransferase involved in cell wall biosynthesis
VLDLAPEERNPALIRERMNPRVELVEGLSHRDLLGFIEQQGTSRVISVGRDADAFVGECLKESPTKPKHVRFISRQTGSYFFETNLEQIRSNLGHFHGHVTQSADHEVLLELVQFDKKRVQFFHNGVTVPEESCRKEGFRVAMCARGTASKGWATAIGAVRQLIEEGEQVELLLIGSRRGLDDLKHLASEHIHFLGPIAAPQSQLQECTLGLLPTRNPQEGLPNSILDYFAAGLPTIASNLGGIPRLIDHPEHPAGVLLQNPSNVAECAVAIRNYIHNPSLLRRHKGGVRAMQKLVDIETIADQWLDWMGGITD